MHGTIDLAPALKPRERGGGKLHGIERPGQIAVEPPLTRPLHALENTIAQRNPDVISVDLFDTLLLRSSEPMRVRWMGAAYRAAAMLNHHGNRRSPNAILAARAAATRASTAMRGVFGGPEDIPLQAILGQAARILGLPQSSVPILIEAELAEEHARLTPNRPLLRLLARHSSLRRICVTSDTNLSAPMLRDLLDHFEAPLRFDSIRTSADLGLTKQTGSIFPALVALEGVRETRILHIGDDAVADVEMPSRHGIAPFHLQRSGLNMVLRRARKFLVKAVHGER